MRRMGRGFEVSIVCGRTGEPLSVTFDVSVLAHGGRGSLACPNAEQCIIKPPDDRDRLVTIWTNPQYNDHIAVVGDPPGGKPEQVTLYCTACDFAQTWPLVDL